jgi:hypothetical protein
MSIDLHIQPSLRDIAELAKRAPEGELFGYTQSTWREKSRRELGLVADRPIIATGHQTLLWHPGILAKYLALDVVSSACGFAKANLVVDQHIDRFGEFDVPIRRSDGTLATRTIELTASPPDVPMGLQQPFDPPDAPAHWPYALDSVRDGVARVTDVVRAHRHAPNAALQMAAALADLMSRWVPPMPDVTASDLGETTLAREMLARMAVDPHTMAEHYNRAVEAVPEAGIPPLLVRDDYVEVPLWRIRPDGRRMRAYDSDVQHALDEASSSSTDRLAEVPLSPKLLPRALFMTALVRLGMCDLFIHGTGGANYDRAMEHWIRNWLGVEVAPIAVVTATLRLPLGDFVDEAEVERAIHSARRAWHDPESISSGTSPGPTKQALLEQIKSLPPGSMERRAAFFQMHHRIAQFRDDQRAAIEERSAAAEHARRMAESRAVSMRRDWPFALYPQDLIDELADAICQQASTSDTVC